MRREDIILDDALHRAVVLVLLIISAMVVLEPVYHDWLSSTVLGRIIEDMLSTLKEEVSPGEGSILYTLLEILGIIYVRNISVTLILAITSITILIPLAILVFNGMVIGYTITYVFSDPESPLFHNAPGIAATLIVHGAVEIPAVSLLVAATVAALRHPKRALSIAIRVLPVSVILLIVAGIVEAFITPIIATFILSAH